jgi:hypothetical protein
MGGFASDSIANVSSNYSFVFLLSPITRSTAEFLILWNLCNFFFFFCSQGFTYLGCRTQYLCTFDNTNLILMTKTATISRHPCIDLSAGLASCF